VTFARLSAWDWVAFIAALALLFVTAVDWYSTAQGDEARRIERLSQPDGALGGEVEREVRESARIVAEGQEKNAWQLSGAIDRVILAGLLVTAALAVLAAFAAASGRASRSAIPPAGLAGIAAATTALLVFFRIVQEAGFDEASTVEAGAPLSLVVLGLIGYAGARAMGAAREEDQSSKAPA
jgi:hypothetical protein